MRPLTAGAAWLLLFGGPVSSEPLPRLRHVTTARQKGPVGHRDPIGVLSPDGKWIAYSEGRFVKLQRVEGGPVQELEPMNVDVREIAWLPDSLRLAVPDRSLTGRAARWFVYDRERGGKRTALWADAGEIAQLAFAEDGSAYGVKRTAESFTLVRRDREGRDSQLTASSERISHPFVHSGGIACLIGRRLDPDCTDSETESLFERDLYGPFAFDPDGKKVYFASPNDRDTLDLWSREDGRLARLTSFARDTYAPSVGGGKVLFKVQDYRTFVAAAPATGGETTPLTVFPSETPSWDPHGSRIAFTFGNWRRVLDDARYPDIAQHVGFIRLDVALPAEGPHGIVSASDSEDQGQAFSPDGRWIAFHSHYGPSDDIWIVPADLSKAPRQLTTGGYETGWPRWSKDGRFVLYSTAKGREAPGRAYVLRVDAASGELIEPEREIPLRDFEGEVSYAEWIGGSDEIAIEAVLAPGRKGIYRVGREGGPPRLVHEFACEERTSAISVSPDGRWIAYVAPGPDGYQQVFRVPSSGGTPEPLTFDPSNKTHPAYSPDGSRVAFTVFRYEAQFWLLE